MERILIVYVPPPMQRLRQIGGQAEVEIRERKEVFERRFQNPQHDKHLWITKEKPFFFVHSIQSHQGEKSERDGFQFIPIFLQSECIE